MIEESGIECPNCGKKTISPPRVAYGVFRGRRYPDGVCTNCGTFYWEHPRKSIPAIVFKPVEQKNEEKKNWFEVYIQQGGEIVKKEKYSLKRSRN